MTPWMDDTEIALILKHLYYTDTMLEWGSGGSTTYFPHFVNKYYSIEHDAEWSMKVKEEMLPNVEFHHVPWDAPRTKPTQRSQFETYIRHADTTGSQGPWPMAWELGPNLRSCGGMFSVRL